MYDLVVRGGLVADGSGSALRVCDVAIEGNVVAAVERGVGAARREIDADGLLVTPGFVDLHTHFDGQATWDGVLGPSSWHGVTSVVMGNCGVGFAPVEPDRHDWLVSMMEGVEDIPGTALSEGMRWGWQSFPEYLDELERLPRVLDVGAQVPHAPVRAYVMGERGADPDEEPTDGELAEMVRIAGDALDAGALGLSSSRTELHRTSSGHNLGTLRASSRELVALASVLGRRRRGVLQLLSDCYRSEDADYVDDELNLIAALARASRRPVSYSVQQYPGVPDRWRALMLHAERLSAEGYDVKAQVAPRPIGVLLGLEATTNPFAPCRAFKGIAGLPLAEKVRAMRDPALRDILIASHLALTSGPDAFPGLALLARYEDMYVLGDPVDYSLGGETSIAASAAALGQHPAEHLYDVLLRDGGRQLLYQPVFNFAERNLDAVRAMIGSPAALFGLSDAGAHCGTISDASMTTTYLSLWGRDRRGDDDGIALEHVVHHLTARTAHHVGWLDRGLLRPGCLADVNVIDLEALGCHPPVVADDLPAGGRRLVQAASGYRYTVKSGEVTYEDGERCGPMPGGLVRGPTRPPR